MVGSRDGQHNSDSRGQGRLAQARQLEKGHRLLDALAEYMLVGSWSDAARILSHMSRFHEAGLVLLLNLSDKPTPIRYLPADGRRRCLDAALCFARGGARREAVGLLVNLGERSKAANLLMRAGLKSEAVAAMRGEGISESPWPEGIVFPLHSREELTARFVEERAAATHATSPATPAALEHSDPRLEFQSVLAQEEQSPPAREDSGEQVPTIKQAVVRRSRPRGDATQTAPGVDFDRLYRSDSLRTARPSDEAIEKVSGEFPTGENAPPAPSLDMPRIREVRDGPLVAVTPQRGYQEGGQSGSARVVSDLDQSEGSWSDTDSEGDFDDGLIKKGVVISDRFVVESKLGVGGMATVYRVFDRELQEDVALKLFRVVVDDQVRLRRFRREMKIHRRLVHPNIVRTYDFGTWRGARYITMELLEGEDLSSFCRSQSGIVDFAVALQLMMQACDGLNHAHEEGIIHRDVKPANLFVMAGGRRLKVMDFGVAKAVDSSSISITGVRVGTPRYMSPEQIQGNAEITLAADLYSLGAVMYEVFTGSPVFEDEDLMPLLLNHLSEEPIPPRDVDPRIPREVEEIILRLLAKNPRERYPDAQGVKSALLRAFVASQRL